MAYQQIFEDQGLISSAVVISPPDTREGHEEVDAESRDAVAAWWSKHVGKEAESKYTQRVLDRFATEGDPQLLIVVSKLLTGFDEPRNMVLYIDKPLKQHELLQAIARVNRLHELKKSAIWWTTRASCPRWIPVSPAITDWRSACRAIGRKTCRACMRPCPPNTSVCRSFWRRWDGLFTG